MAYATSGTEGDRTADGRNALRVVSRRAVLGYLVAGAGATLLAACSPAAPAAPATAPTAPTAAPTTALARAPAAAPTSAPAPVPAAGATAVTAAKPAAQPQPQPRSGGTLRIANTLEIPYLDGHVVTPALFDSVWMALEPLVRYDEKLQLQGALAETWEISSDAKQVKFNLRKGVQFHSGRELTSDDVKWNILRVRQPVQGTTQFATQSNWFTGIETPDKSTIILKSDEPRPVMFDFFAFLNIVDPAYMESPDAARKVVGTGPFAFAEWVQGERIRFTKNKSYWQSGKPYLDQVVMSTPPDAQAAAVQVESGTIDAVISPPLRDAQRLRQDARFKVLVNDLSGRYYLVVANTTILPFDNKLVRQALNYAIDRKRFVETQMLGIGEPRSLPWIPQSPAADPEKNSRYTFDLDKAKALLGQAGMSNVEFNFNAQAPRPEMAAFGQILQADLQKIGVKMTVKNLERAVWEDELNNLKHQVSMGDSAPRGVDPVSLLGSSVFWNATHNSSGYRNEKYVQLLDQATKEADAAKRKQIYAQLNDIILDESFAIPMTSSPRVVLAKANVNGLRYDPTEALVYTDAWLGA